MKKSRFVVSVAGVLLLALLVWAGRNLNLNPARTPGEAVDSLHGVVVCFNGGVGHVAGRNVAPDGYNLGLKYQCVEFVKRYYYVHYGHRMPDSYGHARDFFDPALADGQVNARRGLRQFANPSRTRPQVGDLLVFGPTWLNPYGHVAIVSQVAEPEIELIQQNPGPFGAAREHIGLAQQDGKWHLEQRRVLGWLRK